MDALHYVNLFCLDPILKFGFYEGFYEVGLCNRLKNHCIKSVRYIYIYLYIPNDSFLSYIVVGLFYFLRKSPL